MRTPSVYDSRTSGRVVKYPWRRSGHRATRKDMDILKCANDLIKESHSNLALQNNVHRGCGEGE